MKFIFKDLQQSDNPLNGKAFASVAEMVDLLRLMGCRKPFLFELRGDNGFMLTVGFADELGTAQHSPNDGSPPYFMAMSNESVEDSGYLEFLAGNTPTPIPRRFVLPMSLIKQAASDFIGDGKKSGAVNWEEI